MLLSAGVMIVMWEGSVSSSVPGMLLCVAATVCNGVTMSTIGKVMSKDVHVLLLTFYTAPVSFMALVPPFMVFEVGETCIICTLCRFTDTSLSSAESEVHVSMPCKRPPCSWAYAGHSIQATCGIKLGCICERLTGNKRNCFSVQCGPLTPDSQNIGSHDNCAGPSQDNRSDSNVIIASW